MSGNSLIGDYLENLPLRLVDRLSRPLSASARGRFADWLGRRVILNLPALRRRGERNLALIYPDKPQAERDRILAETAGNVGRTLLEMRTNHRLMQAAERGEIKAEGDEGLAVLKAAKAEGRGVLLISGHYGQWDAARAWLKANGMETGGIYRNHDNRFFNADLLPEFEACGTPLFPKGAKGMRALIKHVRGGGFAAIMMDQRVSEGEWLDFMGQPALTATGMAALALKFDLVYMPSYVLREPDGISFRVIFEPPIPHSDARTMTQAANDSLAAMVHKHPTQWHWLHRRWAEGQRASKRKPGEG